MWIRRYVTTRRMTIFPRLVDIYLTAFFDRRKRAKTELQWGGVTQAPFSGSLSVGEHQYSTSEAKLNSYTGVSTRNHRDIYNCITHSDLMTTHEKIQDMHSRSNSLTWRALFTRNLNMRTLFTQTKWQHIDTLIIQEKNKFHRVNSLCHKYLEEI